MIETGDFVRTLMLLDAAQDALAVAARLEKKREQGKAVRQITEQERAKITSHHVAEMAEKYGLTDMLFDGDDL